MKKIIIFSSIFFLLSGIMLAHCDTMDGPVVSDAKKAMEQNNVNYILKWVSQENETEVKNAFNLAMKVRKLNADAMELADKYFFETVVRLHRTGEGMSYTGIKPSGTPVDEKILAADKSIEVKNLSPLKGMIPADKEPELMKRFDKVLSLKDFDVNDVTAGRKYISAYVQFFHFAEGEEEQDTDHNH